MTPARILVVEDNIIVSRDIQQQLRRIGHQVVGAATSGEASIELVEKEAPDLVLMDIRLQSRMDGIEAAEQIRQRWRAPVIFLTAYADDETVRRASHAEPFGYLMKPFDDSQLRTAIEMALYKNAAEKRLRDSERRYAATLSSIGDGVIATDGKGNITFMNSVAETLTGWTLSEATGTPVPEVFRIVNEDTRQVVENPIAKVLRLGTVIGLANHTILIARHGKEFPIDDCGSPIIDETGEIIGAVLVFRDISQKRTMSESLHDAEAHLALASRLSRFGELAASIAHEVNQPLTAIVSNADTCIRYLEEAKRAAERVVNNGHRAGDVVRSIRSLVSRTSSDMGPVDINAVIRDVLEFQRSEIRRSDIHVEMNLVEPLPRIVGDRVQFQQVVLNLVSNAIEVMERVADRPRRLSIATETTERREVLVSIADNGPGIDMAVNERIFEPLFTTKSDGMGLGLSICRSIVEAHKGRIWTATGEPGAIFRFSIPGTDRAAR